MAKSSAWSKAVSSTEKKPTSMVKKAGKHPAKCKCSHCC